MKINLYVVRHGQTSFNYENKVQGWGDSFLTPEGIQGVENLGNYWRNKKKNFSKVYSSDSGRTLQTTRVILETMGKKDSAIIPHSGLREYNFGYYEGYDEALLEKEIYEKANISFNDIIDQPGLIINTIAALDKEKKVGISNTWFSETSDEYSERLVTTIKEIVEEGIKNHDQDILIVSHGMSISFLTALMSENNDTNKQLGVPNASCTKIVYEDGKYQLIYFGEVKNG